MFLPRQCERCLKHKAVDVVMPLEIRPLLLLLFLIEVGHHVRHLDVGKLGVQVFGIYLFLKLTFMLYQLETTKKREVIEL